MPLFWYTVPAMELLKTTLKTSPLFYITRDIERALGFPLSTEGYFIISNSTPFGKSVAEKHVNVLLIEGDQLLDTNELMERSEVVACITKHATHNKPNVVVFKNTPRIEEICKKNDWNLLNPSATFANKVEEKISQVEWLGDLATYLPPHRIISCKDIVWDNTSFILQFNRAHTGTGTLFIETHEQLKAVQSQFPNRPARVTDFISGPVFTSNNIVTEKQTLIGNISYQITGLTPFTDQPFATIGNDWALPHTLLSTEQKEQYKKIVTEVAEKMRADGWKGLFGTDIILNEKTGKLYLLEINARQPASTTFESQLQSKFQIPDSIFPITTFEAHLAALLHFDIHKNSLIELTDGGQVILRNQSGKTFQISEISQKLAESSYTIIPYQNSAPGSDLLRIQSTMGLMENHTVFNETGKKIVACI